MAGFGKTAFIAGMIVSSVASPVPVDVALPRSDYVPDGYYVPAYYPAPYGGWTKDWQESYRKARKLVDSMILAEKTNITGGSGMFMGEHCHGNSGSALRVGFPQLCLNDGPTGIRQADNITVFPAGITTGATFDKKLMYQRGVAIGKEARGKGINVWLGPSVGPIGRKPKGGRNWEGFGADPCLQGVAARETIKGVQEQGVIATIKHWIGYEQEKHRRTDPFQFAYSSNIDDRALHELYAWPFAEGIRAGVGAVMTAYNYVNGTPCSQHPYLINGLLKDELGFQGFVMTDWLGHLTGVESTIAGLDMDMPGDSRIPFFGHSYWMYELTTSVLNGSVPMTRLNDMATRVVAAWYQMGQDKDFPEVNFDTNTRNKKGLVYPAAFPDTPIQVVNKFVPVQADHDIIARQIAQDAITLLKNNDGLLPLSTARPLRIFGTGARANPAGPNACSDRKCNKGTLGQGWGSASADYMYLDDPKTAIGARAKNVKFYESDTFPGVIDVPDFPTYDDVAVVFITSDSGENMHTVEGNHGDRDASGLYAWHQGDKLVQDVAAMYTNVVVVAHTVGPLVLENWISLASVKSVLIAHLPGQEAGRSLAEVLFGDVSPSGHLPYSITKREDDMPNSVTKLVKWAFMNQPQDTYTEGLYIDYRWLNKSGIKPRFAFGHGLSYTDFTYSGGTIVKVTEMSMTPPTRAPKSGLLEYSQPVPPAHEAVKPKHFRKRWRYIYSWISARRANFAVKMSAEKYQYPNGYSEHQRPGPRAGGGEGGNPALWDIAYKLSVNVTNSGKKHSGKASVQAYLQFPRGIDWETPFLQLRDFEKTKVLAPGESTRVELHLTRKDLSVWDVRIQDWLIPDLDNPYKVWLGNAIDDLVVGCDTFSLKCRNV